MAPLPDSVAGFAVLPVQYSQKATHIIYARAHRGSKKASSNSLPEGRTLFLVNVPPDATTRELSLFFKSAGIVENIIFDQTLADIEPQNDVSSDEEDEDVMDVVVEEGGAVERPKKRRKKSKGEEAPKVIPLPTSSVRILRETGKTAYVVFLEASSLSRALSAPQKPRPWPRSEEPLGLAHYLTLYESLRPPLDIVREHADSSIALFDYREAQKKQKSKYRKGEAVVDEDGFTLVTRGGAYGKTLGGEVGVATKKFQKTGEASIKGKKKEAKEKPNFYAFQKHEKKRQELINLKQKWEEDKAKVEKLKQSRHFKPY